MTACTPAGVPAKDFTSAWHEVLIRHQTLIELLLSLVRLTGAGKQPVLLDQIAVSLNRPADEAERLLRELAPDNGAWFGAHIDDGLVYFVLNGNGTKPRFWYHIDDRSIGVDGCAPDSFILAYGLRQPFHVESVCPATGTPIRVDFAEDGATAADPATTVVAVIHPAAAPQAFTMADLDRVDADICVQQPFFASTDAAAGWLATHPGGKAMAVKDFDHIWRQLIDQTQPQH